MMVNDSLLKHHMNIPVYEKVSVVVIYRPSLSSTPRKMKWQAREYIFTKYNYHHAIRKGRTLFHIFHLSSEKMDFRLCFDTESLEWTLEEVYDGNTD